MAIGANWAEIWNPAVWAAVWTQDAVQPPVVVETDSSAGGWHWAAHYERNLAERRRRRRELEEAAEAVEQIDDTVDHEIAELLLKARRDEERIADLEKIRQTLNEFADAKAEAATSLRLRGAYNRARLRQTSNALRKFDKELKRVLEEEEMAVIMLLVNED